MASVSLNRELLYSAALRAVCGAVAVLACAADAASGQQERTAEATYHNVQVLGSLPASTFMNTMFFQRYALGVSCTYCHVDGKWESDDKPAKVKARQMIRMVLDLNRNNFDGKPVVGCMTCHRGSTTPARDVQTQRLSFDRLLGPRPAPGAKPTALPTLPTVDAVISRYLDSLGGVTALAKIKSRSMKGNLITAEGAIVPFEEAMAVEPVRWAYIRHFGQDLGDFSTVVDGTTAWNHDNRGLTELDRARFSQAVMTVRLALGADPRELYASLAVVPPIAGDTAHTIVLEGKSSLTGMRDRLFFDTISGLLVRRSTFTDGAFGSFTTDVYYENYRTIDGVRLPILVSEFTPDFGTVRKVFSVEHNPVNAAGLFAKP